MPSMFIEIIENCLVAPVGAWPVLKKYPGRAWWVGVIHSHLAHHCVLTLVALGLLCAAGYSRHQLVCAAGWAVDEARGLQLCGHSPSPPVWFFWGLVWAEGVVRLWQLFPLCLVRGADGCLPRALAHFA